jgi:hypothetical protein
VQTPLYLFDELLRAATENKGACFGFGAIFKQVVPFPSDLLLLERAARPQMFPRDIGAG